MKKLSKNLKSGALLLLASAIFGAFGLTGCATGEGSNAGKIGPDYDNPMQKQMQMQEAQSRVTRSLVR